MLEMISFIFQIQKTSNLVSKASILIPTSEQHLQKLFTSSLDPDSKLMKYSCIKCPTSTCRRYNMLRHVKSHMSGYHRCAACNLYFESLDDKVAHQTEKHTSVLCNICGKTFGRNSTLKMHLTTHGIKADSVKEMKCPVQGCTKTFYQKQRLNFHMNKHTNVKPFKCNICEETFHNAYSMRSHAKICESNLSHTCRMCGAVFRTETSLNEHFQASHTSDSFKCKCGSSFKYRSGLYRHIKYSSEKASDAVHEPLDSRNGTDGENEEKDKESDGNVEKNTENANLDCAFEPSEQTNQAVTERTNCNNEPTFEAYPVISSTLEGRSRMEVSNVVLTPIFANKECFPSNLSSCSITVAPELYATHAYRPSNLEEGENHSSADIQKPAFSTTSLFDQSCNEEPSTFVSSTMSLNRQLEESLDQMGGTLDHKFLYRPSSLVSGESDLFGSATVSSEMEHTADIHNVDMVDAMETERGINRLQENTPGDEKVTFNNAGELHIAKTIDDITMI